MCNKCGGIGVLRNAAPVETRHMVPTEQPTAFSHNLPKFNKKKNVCTEVCKQMHFLNRWVFPYSWSHAEGLLCGSCLVAFLVVFFFLAGWWLPWQMAGQHALPFRIRVQEGSLKASTSTHLQNFTGNSVASEVFFHGAFVVAIPVVASCGAGCSPKGYCVTAAHLPVCRQDCLWSCFHVSVVM